MQGLISVTRIYWKHAAILLAIGSLLQFAPALTPGQAGAQHAAPLHVTQRNLTHPPITGIAYVRLYSSNIEKSKAFYSGALGLPSAGGNCSGVTLPCFPVNWYQQVELQPAGSPRPKTWLAEIGFATDDVSQLHAYLQANGLTPGAISKDAGGNPYFALYDPEGNPVAFVQKPMATADYKISPIQMGSHLIHAGFVVKDVAAENKFYVDVLGFKLYWQGGFKDDGLDWYEIQVPDGSDWIEYMLNIPANADHKELGVQNHFSLGVKDIHAAADQLHKNGVLKFDGPEIGRDGKWGLDGYDPDGTRVEVMEFTPAGKPCCHPYTAAHPTP